MRITALALVALVGAAGCYPVSLDRSCRSGETRACWSSCGPGLQSCQGGELGTCLPVDEVPCLPGQTGRCELEAGEPGGTWFCTDDCRRGECLPLCQPGDESPCQAECGPGARRCTETARWSECLEYVVPDCRPGEVERCGEHGDEHRRCTASCTYGPCDGGVPCAPGERARCSRCATQACLADGTWGECEAAAGEACEPGQTRSCEAPCGPGEQRCSDDCAWGECWELEASECHPGEVDVCRPPLGSGIRSCRSSCAWGECHDPSEWPG